MLAVEWEVTATHKQNPDASFSVWDCSPSWAVERVIEWETPARIPDYFVTVRYIPSGRSVTFDGADYVLDGGPDLKVPCDDCGGPCDATDAVADDAGQAWCGSVYGNGCAERVTA